MDGQIELMKQDQAVEPSRLPVAPVGVGSAAAATQRPAGRPHAAQLRALRRLFRDDGFRLFRVY